MSSKEDMSAKISALHVDVEEQDEVEIEIRGARSKDVIPKSLVCRLPRNKTVREVKEHLKQKSDIADFEKLDNNIKFVFEGRSICDDETIVSLMKNEQESAITLYAVFCDKLPPSPSPKTAAAASSSSSAPSSAPFSPVSGSSAPPPTPGSPKWLEEVKAKVELNMRKAFYDLLENALNPEKPDHEWIVRLYAEMRDRLCALTPRRQDIREEIHEKMDVSLFQQMLTNNAFEVVDLQNLVGFTFARLQLLCSPARDDEIKERRRQLEDMIVQPDMSFGKFVACYLKFFHITVNDIEKDIEAFKSQMQSGTFSPQQSPKAASPATSGDVLSPNTTSAIKDIKTKLRQLGVAEEKISECVEKRDLLALLDQATGRVAGEVTGLRSQRQSTNRR
uniref:Ubiquitin-like domain-containing protein n=1 Tax=Hanusia phi TaxID=3032 RepID=A0A6T7QZ90_9CRYP